MHSFAKFLNLFEIMQDPSLSFIALFCSCNITYYTFRFTSSVCVAALHFWSRINDIARRQLLIHPTAHRFWAFLSVVEGEGVFVLSVVSFIKSSADFSLLELSILPLIIQCQVIFHKNFFSLKLFWCFDSA